MVPNRPPDLTSSLDSEASLREVQDAAGPIGALADRWLDVSSPRGIPRTVPYGLTRLKVPPKALIPFPFPAVPVVTSPVVETNGCSWL
jgi:hypothetical protein